MRTILTSLDDPHGVLLAGGMPNSHVVLKFGGTSVSSAVNWGVIAAQIRARLDEGLAPIVVCSALSGVSNALESLLHTAANGGDHAAAVAAIEQRHRDLAGDLGVGVDALAPHFELLSRLATGIALIGEVSPRLHARVMAQGELMSTRLGAAWLQTQGIAAEWVDARTCLQALVEPRAPERRSYLSATCHEDSDPALVARLPQVTLTQGFIASNVRGETVLLGRGGSDTTAAYFAARTNAVRCEIWTDVPGMYTANPRDIPNARLLKALDYDEAQEIATTGAKVLHPRCISPCRRHRIPLHIRCTPAPDIEGTVITGEIPDASAQVKSVSAKTGITLISMDTVGMWQQVGFLADVFACFKAHGLSVDLVSTSEMNVTVSLDPASNALDGDTIDALMQDLSPYCRARNIGPCAAVSLVGRRIRGMLPKLGPALEVFEEQQIHLVSQAASDLNLTFVVDEDQQARLVARLHSLLFAHRRDDSVLGPPWQERFGPPEASTELVPRWWLRRRDELLALGARSPLYVYDPDALRDAARGVAGLSNVDRVFFAVKANNNADVLRVLEGEGIGFECVSPGELRHVRALFPELPAERMLFTPNFAGRDEYAEAFVIGAHVTLDNLHPLQSWPEVFAGQALFVRVDPGQGRGHHPHVRTAGAHSKFGVWPDELPEVKRLADAVGARIVGLHAHTGSGIRTPDNWRETAAFLASVAESFPDVEVLDVGGGLGVPEKPGQRELDLSRVDALLTEIRAAYPKYRLWLEPGRYLVALAGVLLTRVTQLKTKGDMRYVGVDTGMNSLIRPALYGAFHEIVNLTRHDQPATEVVNVVGPICESGDTLGHARRLPPTEEGDVLLIATAGAYGRVMSSRYNLREPADETLLP